MPGTQPSGSERGSSPRAVHQVLVSFHRGDAVGNEALVIRGHLRRAGFASEIFAETVDSPLRHEARALREYREAAASGGVCLFHLSPGGAAPGLVEDAPHRLVVVYHNLTPARFFEGWDEEMARLAVQGRALLARLAPRAELALAKSEFSRRELEQAGYARTAVLPVLLDLDSYSRPPSPVLLRLFGDGRRNVLCVGRIAPNKGLDDAIRAFAVLQRRLEPRSRLLLVGSHGRLGWYRAHLQALALELRLRDVVFTGHLAEDDLRSCYRAADLLLCLSEHEGYGVPLVEAMLMRLPVIAFAAAAVPETLRGGGLLLEEKSPELVAELMGRVLADRTLRAAILASQDRALAQLRATDFGALLLDRLAPVLGPPPHRLGSP